MEPATRILSHQSTKSYLERELIVSLDDNGPMIGPSLEVMHTHPEEEHYMSTDSSDEKFTSTKQLENSKQHWWNKSTQKDCSDPKKFPRIKKNTILVLVAVGGAM